MDVVEDACEAYKREKKAPNKVTVHLTRQGEELVKEQLAQGRFRSAEEVIERALENLAHKDRGADSEAQRQAVRDMLDFVRKNRVRLETGASAKDLIHQGHRV